MVAGPRPSATQHDATPQTTPSDTRLPIAKPRSLSRRYRATVQGYSTELRYRATVHSYSTELRYRPTVQSYGRVTTESHAPVARAPPREGRRYDSRGGVTRRVNQSRDRGPRGVHAAGGV
eukprot:1196394-Prorocentrum_minimum.AAC.5